MKSFPIILLSLCVVVAATAQELINVSPGLSRNMQAQPQQRHEVLIVLNDQAPLDDLIEQARNNPAQRNEIRGVAVRQMQSTANQTQPAFRKWLAEATSLNNRDIRAYWVVNSLQVTLDPGEIREVAAHPDVRYITEPALFDEGGTMASAPPVMLDTANHEIGLDVINAPALWKMGYTGYGTKVYVYDTGIDIDHPALRANFAYHNDPLAMSWRGKGDDPYTCNSHGTHVAGTILGLDREANDTIGVAFNARYMMSPQFTSCGSERLGNMEAWEWVLDPDGDPFTTDDIPDASNMSGGSRVTDTICGIEFIDLLFQGLQIGNVGALFAGGNEGPGDSTHRSPAVHNFDLVHAFAVGNLDASSLEINNSSSRGPSYCFSNDSSLAIKPEVSAPGTSVRSSIVGGGYDWFTGTSMASPHVAGAFLLLKEAYPFLSEEQILMALYTSASDYGVPGEDNVYGMGVIDVLAAFHALQDQGFTPLPPLPRDKDLVVVDLSLDRKRYCSKGAQVEVKFENAGLDTIFDVRLDFTEANGLLESFSRDWSGVLAPDEIARISLEIPEMESSGTYELLVQALIPGNSEEVRLLDNQFKRRFRVYEDEDFAVLPAYQEGPGICAGAQTWLTTADDPLPGQKVTWFVDDPSGTPAGEGTSFLSPAIYSSRTVFAVLETEYKTGLPLDGASLDFGEENLGGLVFDAVRPFTLNSIRVNSGDASGGRMIRLTDSEGNPVRNKLTSVSAGEKEIQLNWSIPAGKGYRLEIGTGKPLAHVSGFNEFPIQVNDLVSIRSGIYDGEEASDTYYYFFDWKITAEHPCGPASIELTANSTDTLPVLEIISSADTAFLSDGGMVMLEASGAGYESFEWELGNSESFTEQNIVATFTQPGSYLVSLNASTANGCSSGAAREIIVIDDLQTSTAPARDNAPDINIFPNPARNTLYVQFDRSASGSPSASEISVFDMLGRKMVVRQINRSAGVVKLDVSGMAPGQYVLHMEGRNAIFMIR